MTSLLRSKPLLACAAAAACVVLVACGTAVTTSSFRGEEREVAQALSNLQSHVTGSEQAKVCSDDLASEVVARLNAAPGGCTAALKEALAEIDSSSLTINSIQLSGTGAARSALASVKTTYAGKTRASTVTLIKEAGKWKLRSVS
ncbi:MAG TPA: hypothetical protein VNZ05_01615 [Solirubrobacteraceae bacterium]|jgi:hypothetical protein|nr:hypothetical protein [Solirubrobacteraceae bacterium]